MRCTDCGEMRATIPPSLSDRANSAHVHSERERPRRSGSSQASLTRCAATSGGKTGWTPAPLLIVKAVQPHVDKPLAPLADHLAPDSQVYGDVREGVLLGEAQNDLCAHDVSVGPRPRACHML